MTFRDFFDKAQAGFYTLLVHAVLIALLLVSLDWAPEPAGTTPEAEPMQAVVVDEGQVQAEVQRLQEEERKQERRDLADFQDLLSVLSSELSDGDYQAAVELVQDSARLRGYGHVKDRNRERVLAQREVLLRRFRGEADESMVRVVEAA